MNLNHNQDGFTLIEVMVAVAIMGIVLAPIFLIQGNVLLSVGRFSRLTRRFFYAQNYLLTNQIIDEPEATKVKKEKTVEDPQGTLEYDIKPITKNSIFKNFEHMYREQVLVQWRNFQGRALEEPLVTFLYRPPKESEKK